MEKKLVTLRQAVQILEEQGIVIDWDGKLTMSDFLSYFDHHYKTACETGDFPKVSFFYTDILEIFK